MNELLNIIAAVLLIVFIAHQMYFRTLHFIKRSEPGSREIYTEQVHGWLSWALLLSSIIFFILATQIR